jgi:hypothetical protein
MGEAPRVPHDDMSMSESAAEHVGTCRHDRAAQSQALGLAVA